MRRAGLVHDVGRTSISTAIWERDGPLSAGESDQVRLHAYWSERVLARTDALAALAPLAGGHHERLDGSGYHRGVASAALHPRVANPRGRRRDARAEEDRPHRPARNLDDAARVLNEEARAGRLDPEAVGAVIEAAGAPRPRTAWPAELTDREVEVMRLAARGLSNKDIAARVGDSPANGSTSTSPMCTTRLADEHGLAPALFAMEHGLLEPGALWGG